MQENTLYIARATSELPAAGESIQMFPPGQQVVTPTRADGGKPEEISLVIDAQTAADLETLRASLQAKADTGEGDAPYFDFNHEDREAAAWPRRIYWAGDDPKTGGVRAEVEWSAAGQAAVSGRTFRRFSPAFYAAAGRVTGAPLNMGGLVNRAAFTRISPLFAKEPTASPETNTNTMTPEEITALQQENAALKSQLAELEKSLTEMKKKDAESTVAQAAKDGRIGTDPTLQAKWVDSIVKDPAARELLLSMAPNPALTTKVTDASRTTEDKPTGTPAALLAKYNALPRAEKEAFYAAHAAELKAAHAAALHG